MTRAEQYCADQLRHREGEVFLAVGEAVGPALNPDYENERRLGRAESLPDLLSTKRELARTTYRLREVKYKLDAALVRKAVSQLESGAECLARTRCGAELDRLEIVVPLRDRALKPAEREFLGAPLGEDRFALRLGDSPVHARLPGDRRLPVTVLLL